MYCLKSLQKLQDERQFQDVAQRCAALRCHALTPLSTSSPPPAVAAAGTAAAAAAASTPPRRTASSAAGSPREGQAQVVQGGAQGGGGWSLPSSLLSALSDSMEFVFSPGSFSIKVRLPLWAAADVGCCRCGLLPLCVGCCR